jgi:hypothetical protein
MTESVPFTHDGGDFASVSFRVVATWPARAFVENVAVGPRRFSFCYGSFA